ncbi:hypothetical protein AB0A63_04660 [Lentzea sp. NPDC042327]|uniref:hypothetical protein n=1 Tax=Lentzea sp. NPDC042327 TaxID=3154801 RepID=UPI0033F2C818
MRSVLPLPSVSLGVALITAAIFAAAVLNPAQETATPPSAPEAAAPTEGGTRPPMEFTPSPAATTRPAPAQPTTARRAPARPVTPPPHSNPVVRPVAPTARRAVPTVLPSVVLPPLTSPPVAPWRRTPAPSRR